MAKKDTAPKSNLLMKKYGITEKDNIVTAAKKISSIKPQPKKGK